MARGDALVSGNLYRARQAMMAEVRDVHPDARFYDALSLRDRFPAAYVELARIVEMHGRSLAECICFETAAGFTIAFATANPEELSASGHDAVVQSWRVR